MYAGKYGTEEECNHFVEDLKKLYNVTSCSLSKYGAPDENGKQLWHVDVNFVKRDEYVRK